MTTFPLADPVALEDPFPHYARFRREAPVYFHEPWQAWFFFRQDDIAAMSRDDHLSNKRMDLFVNAAPEHLRKDLGFLEEELGEMVLMLDGERHHHVRQIMQQGFSNQAIRRLQERIALHVERLLAKVEGRSGFDASQEVCRPLPIMVIADILGIPEEDFPRVLGWANAFVDYFNRMPAPEEQALKLIHGGRELIDYTRALVAKRRREPGTDFISTLITAESDGYRLNDAEVVANAVVLFIAGTDTVGSALGNAVGLLLSHPEELAKLRNETTSWETGFEEVMRYEPANPVILRRVATTFTHGEYTLTAGQEVFLVLASGNRDEAHVKDPERFDVSRGSARHLGFGAGAHYCLGAMLARAQAAAFLPRLFGRFPELQLDPTQPPQWLRTLGVRGPVTLPVIARRDVGSRGGP